MTGSIDEAWDRSGAGGNESSRQQQSCSATAAPEKSGSAVATDGRRRVREASRSVSSRAARTWKTQGQRASQASITRVFSVLDCTATPAGAQGGGERSRAARRRLPLQAAGACVRTRQRWRWRRRADAEPGEGEADEEEVVHEEAVDPLLRRECAAPG